MTAWRKLDDEEVFRHSIFSLERQELERDGAHKEALVVRAPDWVNVIPVLDDGRVLLIRQWRYGIATECLEIPGGLIDPGETEQQAAERELLEETGYRAGEWQLLGFTHPNPAFMSNRLTTFLATGLTLEEPDTTHLGDDDEHITLLHMRFSRALDLIRAGALVDAKSVSCILFARTFLMAKSGH